MRKQEILWGPALTGKGPEPSARGRFLGPPQLGVPPIPRQETGVIPPVLRRLGEAYARSRPQPLPVSALIEPIRNSGAGGWEGPVGEIRGLSEQGRLMESTFSATVRRCGNGRHAGAATVADRQTALSQRALPPLQR